MRVNYFLSSKKCHRCCCNSHFCTLFADSILLHCHIARLSPTQYSYTAILHTFADSVLLYCHLARILPTTLQCCTHLLTQYSYATNLHAFRRFADWVLLRCNLVRILLTQHSYAAILYAFCWLSTPKLHESYEVLCLRFLVTVCLSVSLSLSLSVCLSACL